MIGVNRELKEKRMKSRMILQVHDELLIETHPDEIETVKRSSNGRWNSGFLRCAVDRGYAGRKNWYEAK